MSAYSQGSILIGVRFSMRGMVNRFWIDFVSSLIRADAPSHELVRLIWDDCLEVTLAAFVPTSCLCAGWRKRSIEESLFFLTSWSPDWLIRASNSRSRRENAHNLACTRDRCVNMCSAIVRHVLNEPWASLDPNLGSLHKSHIRHKERYVYG